MKPKRSDPALYTLTSDDQLISLSGCYVDDLLRFRTAEFRKIANKIHESFDMGRDESLPCAFSIFYLLQNDEGSL